MTGTPGGLYNGTVRISAKADYAIRSLLELTARQEAEGPLSAEAIAAAQDMPFRFLQQVLADLAAGSPPRASGQQAPFPRPGTQDD